MWKRFLCHINHKPDPTRMGRDDQGRDTSYCIRCNEHLTRMHRYDEDWDY